MIKGKGLSTNYWDMYSLIITTALREFLKDRNYAYFRQEQKERDAEEAESRRTYLEWKNSQKAQCPSVLPTGNTKQ